MLKNEKFDEFDPEVKKAFDSVKGCRYIRNHLMRIAEILRGNPKFKAPGTRAPLGMLLYGKNGAGKTTLANCLIRAVGRPSFQLHHLSPLSLNEKQITDIFEAAVNHAPSIIFLDDLDEFGTISRYMEVELAKCMESLEGDNVFVLFTASNYDFYENLICPGKIDIFLDLESPDQEDICEILESSIGALKADPAITLAQISKIISSPETTPLEIHKIINQAVIEAESRNHPYITSSDFFFARQNVKYNEFAFKFEEIQNKSPKNYIKQKAYEAAAKVVALEVIHPGSVGMVAVYWCGGRPQSTISKQREDGEYSAGREEIYEQDIIGNAASKMIDVMKYGIVTNEPIVQAKQACNLLSEIAADGIWFDLELTEITMNQEKIDISVCVLTAIAERIAAYILMKHNRFVDALAEKMIQNEILLDDQIQECRKKSETLTNFD